MSKHFALVLLGVLCLIFLGLWGVQKRLQLFSQRLEPGEIVETNGSDSAQPVKRSQQGDSQASIPFQLEAVATGLVVPWSLVFTSPERMLVSERSGAIREIENNQLNPQPLLVLSQVSSKAEEGLMGLAIDPNYADNQYLYACYAYSQDGSLKDKVVRLIDTGDTILEDRVILDEIPAAAFHAGCALAFGPDEKLYITTGDATNKNIAQDLNSLGGKILRLNADGSIPSDNPIPGSLVYSYGHRNPQGLAWHPTNGLLYATEHGPSGFDGPGGGDEINLIKPGANFGWPIVSHDKTKPEFTAPLTTFTPAEAPASATFYTGDVLPQFSSNLLFGALKGEGIIRVVIDTQNPEKILEIEKLAISVGRIRFVGQGPDGYIYFTTSNRDGRGKVRENDDMVYRLIPLLP